MKAALLTLCSVGLIIVFTISDLSFEKQSAFQGYSFLFLSAAKFSIIDVVLNILLFLPFGFSLTHLLFRRQRLSWRYRLAFVFCAAVGLSYLIEVSQAFTSTRLPSAIDVVANSTGSLIGYVCYLIYAHRQLTVAVCLYGTFVFGIAAVLQQQTTLRNWDSSFPFLLGNERTGDRPWKGRISEVYILDEALSENDLNSGDVPVIVRHSGINLLKSLHWKVVNPEISPKPLIVPRLMQDNSLEAPVDLPGKIWFQSLPPKAIAQRLMQASQFTLLVKAATADTNQKGPARIVSLSWDGNNRNFTLGQAGRDLIFRLRTPVTTENGTRPELRVPGVFADSQVQTIAISYDGSRLVIYINGIQRSPIFELTPGYVALNYIPNGNFLSMRLSKIIFYPILLLPLGGLLSLSICSPGSNRWLYGILTLAASIAFSVVLESVLLAVCTKPFDYENVLLGLISAQSGALAVDYLRRNLVANENKKLLCETSVY